MLNRILGAIGWVGTALVVAAVGAFFLQPQYTYGLALAGLVCVAIYMLGQWRDVAGLFAGRQARLGSITTASIVLVIGIMVGINYIAARQNRRWDLTAARQFSLSDQTRRVLENLQEPVSAKVFSRADDFDRFRMRLNEYTYLSDRLSVEYIDLDREPTRARQYEIQAYGTVVFEYRDRIERITSDLEQDLTNGLIKVVEGQEKKVYFVRGHGEKDTESTERDGYDSIAGALAGDNLSLESLVLAQLTELPDDVAVLVIAGPTADFFPGELELVRNYLEEGGNALFLLDPPASSGAGDLPNLIQLLQEWNVEVGDNVVVDASGMGQLLGTDASVPVAAQYPPHVITERFSFLTAYPLARSVSAITSGGEVSRIGQTFIETGPQSWAEKNIERLTTSREVELNVDEGDEEGPISIGVAVTARVNPIDYTPGDPESGDNSEGSIEGSGDEDTTTQGADDSDEDDEEPAAELQTRLAVIGDSDFAANYALGIQGNRDLFLNTVNWLAEQENLIAIRPREPENRRITLTADQQRRVNWLAMFIIPGLVIVSGVYTWWQKR